MTEILPSMAAFAVATLAIGGTFILAVRGVDCILGLALGGVAKRDEEVPDDYTRGRASAIAEAVERLDRLFVTHGLDDLGSEVCEEVRAMAGDAPGYVGVCRADLEALLDLHDGEPLGLAVPAYDRLRAAARRGRG